MSPTLRRLRGPIAWMTFNRVTPNLLMLVLLIGGFYMSSSIKKEVFPEFDLDLITVRVAYSGASPEEVEQGIILAVEEAVRGLEGIDEMTASAAQGGGTVSLELAADVDRQKVYQEIQQQVDRITTFPEDAEEPQVTLVARRREVLNLQLFGATSEATLRECAEQVRDRLLQEPGISQIDLNGARDVEIRIEIPQQTLQAYGLTLSDVANALSDASVELPGGSLKTAGGDLLLRLNDRREWAREFAAIPILLSASGGEVTLGDLAVVKEGFEESNHIASFNGQRSIELEIYRVGDQTPLGVSEAVRSTMPEVEQDLPTGINWSINRDRSEIYQQRLELLLKNAFMGLLLVLALLGLFLEFKLAFWVTMGIPTSFLGGLLFLPLFGVSINMISMFAFIVALGIVVDDAIVAGENIYAYRQKGHAPFQAAILGARDVAIPITFSILTNIAAFLPLYFVPGVMGKIWMGIPVVVITVFLISWVESVFILPAHLAHTSSRATSPFTARLHEAQQAFSARVSCFIDERYGPLLEHCVRWRGLTVAVAIALLVLVLSYAFSGRIGMILMPRVESDSAVVTAILPVGTALAEVKKIESRLLDGLSRVIDANGGDTLMTGVASQIDENRVRVRAYLTAPGIRPLSTGAVTKLWRSEVGPLVGLESLRYESDRGGPGSGAAVTVELAHRDVEVLERASVALAEKLAEFEVVRDVDDGRSAGKQQLDLRLTPAGEALGLTSRDVARQVRNAFSGAVALRQQRGRHEVTVRVQLPETERSRSFDVENLLIRTPAGRFVPLFEIVRVERGRAFTTISRRDARRTSNVSADVEPLGATGQVTAALDATVLPQLLRDFPGLSTSYQGRQANMRESMQGLFSGFGLALLGIFFLLAIPFRSYVQPLIVMLAIPFGVVGATLGHLLMGYNLSLMSMMGIVALSGVVVNDSLVLIDYANRRRRDGEAPHAAIVAAGTRRFRPVILTTLAAFRGLAPMIFETSRQARFMIPMALSLGFGILFATVITLLIVPALYMLLEDVVALFHPKESV